MVRGIERSDAENRRLVDARPIDMCTPEGRLTFVERELQAMSNVYASEQRNRRRLWRIIGVLLALQILCWILLLVIAAS